MSDYRNMWQDLGLDLAKHDMLLQALPAIYQDVFLTQKDRPKSMDYFDFVISEIHGLRIKELVDHAEKGGQVVATYCVFVPEEIVIAAGGVCVGLCAGAQFSVPVAEQVLPQNTCALIKSSFGFKLGRTCPYVAASHLIVGETTCDGKKKMYELLAEYQPVHVMEIPQKKTAAGRDLFLNEVKEFKNVIESRSGQTITAQNLAKATQKVDGKRRALQRLYDLRKAKNVPISGRDALLATQVSFYDDVDRFTAKVNALCDELDQRVAKNQGVSNGNMRVLISGSPMAIPNWKLHHVVETSGGIVVCEESCIGTRYFSSMTPASDGTIGGQLNAITDRSLNIHCACFTPNSERIDDIIRLAREYRVDGVIHYNLLHCQTYATEAVKVEKALAKEGIPLLRIETDYSEGDTGQLRNRVEAFFEMIRAN